MRTTRVRNFFVALFFLTAITLSSQTTKDAKISPSVSSKNEFIREEQTFIVNGVTETWRLEWRSTPEPVCGEHFMAITCPCIGFGYGEGGQLDLVRLVERREIDRLPLAPPFKDYGGPGFEKSQAVVQRWVPQDEDEESDGLSQILIRRPLVKVMHFADYDHDGNATEFFLQTDSEPCGKRTGVVVGISNRNPRLHAFGTVFRPNEPLTILNKAWEALLGAKGAIKVRTWACGDHGSDTETEIELGALAEGIDARWREFKCIGDGKRGPLVKEEVR